ncbi:phage holin family protein [Nocardioides pocheonensis]|uniref:Phage holin family protein n=1 Tax=Nocardioides pocheonensis TaxID=661485 RepID=A0A3N0GIV5_9ACTN|nr:phage holin family protein [Nocardioides pocheonensis]RNM12397.1 phage holin family protein [Nocardioides pocheonensis]
MKLLLWLVVNAAALGVAVWLFDGITLTADTTGGRIGTLLVVGAIFGVITAVVRPIVSLLSLPLIILTLGLMLLVINALMLLLTSKVADTFGLGFHVDGFWTAVFGAIVISISSMVVEALLPDAS